MNKIKRIDTIFSYWLFFWFLLYYYKFTQYNPYFGLFIGLIINIIMFVLFVLNKNYYKAFLFFIVNLCIKIIPIYLLSKSKLLGKDILAFVYVFGIYILYCQILDLKYLDFDMNYYKTPQIKTPFMYMLDKIIKIYQN